MFSQGTESQEGRHHRIPFTCGLTQWTVGCGMASLGAMVGMGNFGQHKGWIQETHGYYRVSTEGNSHSNLKTSHRKRKPAKCVNMPMLIRLTSYPSMLSSLIRYSSKYLHRKHTFHTVNLYNSLFFSFWQSISKYLFQTCFEYNFQVTESNGNVLYGLERQDKGGGSG